MIWLDRERLTVYPRIICVIYLVVLGYLYLTGSGLTDGRGHPIGGDFCHYWVASSLALKGEAAAVYSPSRLFAAQVARAGWRKNYRRLDLSHGVGPAIA